MQNLSDQYLMLMFKLPSNDLDFYLFHLPRTSQINCDARPNT